jgi:hypothetical protein
LEEKWRDALNVSSAKPATGRLGGEVRKSAAEKQAGNLKKPWNSRSNAGVAAVEVTQVGERKRRSRFFLSLGCNKFHPIELLKGLEPEAKDKDFNESALCLFSMRNSIESKNKSAKPECRIRKCKGLYAEELHALLAGETLSVNVMENEEEDDDKEGCVNTVA